MRKKLFCVLVMASYCAHVLPVYGGGVSFFRQEQRQDLHRQKKKGRLEAKGYQESAERIQANVTVNPKQTLTLMTLLAFSKFGDAAPTTTPHSFKDTSQEEPWNCQPPFSENTTFSVMDFVPKLHLLSSGKILGDFGSTELSGVQLDGWESKIFLIRAQTSGGDCYGLKSQGEIVLQLRDFTQDGLPYARDELVKRKIGSYAAKHPVGDVMLPKDGTYGYVCFSPKGIDVTHGVYSGAVGGVGLDYQAYKARTKDIGPIFLGVQDATKTRFFLKIGPGAYIQVQETLGQHLDQMLSQFQHLMEEISKCPFDGGEDLFNGLTFPTTTTTTTTTPVPSSTSTLPATTFSPALEKDSSNSFPALSQPQAAITGAGVGIGVSAGLLGGAALTGLGVWAWKKWKTPRPVRLPGDGSRGAELAPLNGGGYPPSPGNSRQDFWMTGRPPHSSGSGRLSSSSSFPSTAIPTPPGAHRIDSPHWAGSAEENTTPLVLQQDSQPEGDRRREPRYPF